MFKQNMVILNIIYPIDNAYESYKSAQEINLFTNIVETNDNKKLSINSESSKYLRENQYSENSIKKSRFSKYNL